MEGWAVRIRRKNVLRGANRGMVNKLQRKKEVLHTDGEKESEQPKLVEAEGREKKRISSVKKPRATGRSMREDQNNPGEKKERHHARRERSLPAREKSLCLYHLLSKGRGSRVKKDEQPLLCPVQKTEGEIAGLETRSDFVGPPNDLPQKRRVERIRYDSGRRGGEKETSEKNLALRLLANGKGTVKGGVSQRKKDSTPKRRRGKE